MSIIDRILGRTPNTGTQITVGKPPASRQPPVSVTAPAAAPSKDPGTAAPEPLIRVYDQFGRAFQLGRETWRKDILLPNLQSSRDDPEALLNHIVSALNDDFAADVLESARHLAVIDPKPPRAITVLGAVLLQLKDFAGARDVLERALARHADDPYLLANLARACAALGDEQRAQKLIWLALSLDPNDESSLSWLITLAHARGGAQAALDAYTRAASLPGSWRAQLWLARHALENDDLGSATRFYEEALGRASPVPADLLMQMSGDLGNRGHTGLLVQLTQARFDAFQHGLLVGNNLLRAYLELGLLPQARKLLEQLYTQQRPDWREHLQFWEEKLDEAAKRHGEVSSPVEMMIMKLEHPLWAHGVLGFEAVLPAKTGDAPRINFVCGSGDSAHDTGGKVVSQPTDQLGRLTRALPLFLAEEIYLGTNARTAFLLPWLKQGGFVLSARPWTRDFLPEDGSPDLVVFLHVDARSTPWTLQVRIDTGHREAGRDDAPAMAFERSFDFGNAAADVLALLQDLQARLTTLLGLKPAVHEALAAPPPDVLPGYLAVTEQALAVAMAARQPEQPGLLYQERAIFDHLFEVTLQAPKLLRPRMLLVNALENQARRRKDIVAEYLGKLALLQEKHPLSPGQGNDLVTAAVRTVTEKARG
jgi:tetratricopeptide (TPR) repeat protein